MKSAEAAVFVCLSPDMKRRTGTVTSFCPSCGSADCWVCGLMSLSVLSLLSVSSDVLRVRDKKQDLRLGQKPQQRPVSVAPDLDDADILVDATDQFTGKIAYVSHRVVTSNRDGA